MDKVTYPRMYGTYKLHVIDEKKRHTQRGYGGEYGSGRNWEEVNKNKNDQRVLLLNFRGESVIFKHNDLLL